MVKFKIIRYEADKKNPFSCTLFRIYSCRYFLGLTMSTLASLADILDGPIARSSYGRKQPVRTVGKYLDTYSDVISHFVVPASLLMEVSDLNPACVLLAALFVCTGVLRHACHEVSIHCTELVVHNIFHYRMQCQLCINYVWN